LTRRASTKTMPPSPGRPGVTAVIGAVVIRSQNSW
jgi:hypothetical protein